MQQWRRANSRYMLAAKLGPGTKVHFQQAGDKFAQPLDVLAAHSCELNAHAYIGFHIAHGCTSPDFSLGHGKEHRDYRADVRGYGGRDEKPAYI